MCDVECYTISIIVDTHENGVKKTAKTRKHVHFIKTPVGWLTAERYSKRHLSTQVCSANGLRGIFKFSEILGSTSYLYSVILKPIVISNPVYSQIFKIVFCIHSPNKLVHTLPPSPVPATHVSYLKPLHSIAIITFYGVQIMKRLGIAAGYWQKGLGSNPDRDEVFCSRPQRPWAHSTHCTVGTGEKTAPPPNRAVVKEKVKLNIYSPYGHSWPLLEWTLRYTLLSFSLCSLSFLLFNLLCFQMFSTVPCSQTPSVHVTDFYYSDKINVILSVGSNWTFGNAAWKIKPVMLAPVAEGDCNKRLLDIC